MSEKLRRHSCQASNNRAGQRFFNFQVFLLQLLAAPKVRDKCISFGIEENVGGLDVPVEDVLCVQVLESHQDLEGVFGDYFFIELSELLVELLEVAFGFVF